MENNNYMSVKDFEKLSYRERVNLYKRDIVQYRYLTSMERHLNHLGKYIFRLPVIRDLDFDVPENKNVHYGNSETVNTRISKFNLTRF